MSDKHFVDTNVLIYTVGDIIIKKHQAIQLLKVNTIISTQVINESVNVMYRKLKYDYASIRDILKEILQRVELCLITEPTILVALTLAEKYRYGYFDSLMIASALEQRCPILYSEDLQHGQEIENQLNIINPFL
jgi:predicted nucleic acid-binding protein